jgi:hypothetical protein
VYLKLTPQKNRNRRSLAGSHTPAGETSDEDENSEDEGIDCDQDEGYLDALRRSLEPKSQLTVADQRALRRRVVRGVAEPPVEEVVDVADLNVKELRERQYTELVAAWKTANPGKTMTSKKMYDLHDEARQWAESVVLQRSLKNHAC